MGRNHPANRFRFPLLTVKFGNRHSTMESKSKSSSNVDVDVDVNANVHVHTHTHAHADGNAVKGMKQALAQHSSRTWVLDEEEHEDECDEALSPTSTRLDTADSQPSPMTPCPLMDHTDTAKHVRFGSAHIRTYPQVLGDHPYCSIGCPVELGWEVSSEIECSVDDYETHSFAVRLSPEERRAILHDLPAQEVRKACRRRNRQVLGNQKASGRFHRQLQRDFFQCPAVSSS